MFDRIAAAACVCWFVLFGIISASLFRWHLDYFNNPGPQFHRLAVILIPALALVAWAYAAVRDKRSVRLEAAVLPAVAFLVCFSYEPGALLVVAVFFCSCSAAGRFALSRFKIPVSGPLERILAGFGAGLGMLNVVLFIAGLAAMLYPATFVLLLLFPLAFFWRDARETVRDLLQIRRCWDESQGILHPLTGIAIVFAAVAMICALMIALAPSLAFDSVAFHLPSVAWYAAHHVLRPVPGIDYSFYPQGMELIWTLAYSLAGQPGAQLLSILFFPIFLLLLVRLARECGVARGPAATGSIFAATMPFLHWSGSVMKNDLALALFEGLALLAFLRWMETRAFRWILAGSFFLAQAFGIKLVALFAAIPLACFYLYAIWREPRRIRAAAAVAAIFLCFGTFWVVRDYWLTGNPVAPETLGAATGKYAGTRSFAGQMVRDASIPVRLFFAGQHFFDAPLPSPAGVVLLAFAPLVLFGLRRTKTKAALVCAIFTAAYLIYWAVVIRKLRYAILPFGLLSIWIAASLWRFYEARSRAVRVAVTAVMTYSLLIATMGMMIVGINGPQFAYFTRKIDKRGYLRSAMTAYGAVDFLREHAPEARVFGVENLARGYSADPTRFHGMFCPDAQPCEEAPLLSAIRSSRADYLILPENEKIPPETIDNLGRPPRVYRDQFFSVYRLSFERGNAGQLDAR